MGKKRLRIVGSLFALAVFFAGLLGVELLLRKRLAPPALSTERNTLYRYDSDLGWFPKPSFEGSYTYEPGHPVRIKHNAMGFRDVEHGPKRGPVLAILGDSYVYGFNVEAGERFSDLLQKKMPAWDIYNLGVSGFGTDQEYLLLQKMFDRIKPDVVLVMVFSNDHEDNSSNFRYGCYKPYFDMSGGRLELRGVPVPKSLLYYPAAYPILFKSMMVTRLAELIWRPIAKVRWPQARVADPTGPLLLDMRDALKRRNVRFAVGFIGYGAEEKVFCSATQLPCFETNSTHLYTTPGGHWNPEGHRHVAEQIHRFLQR